nr:hypothetical protein [uncultured Albidiferax sp.]
MMIKVMSYTAAQPQKPGDLARLLRYMLDAKVGTPDVDAALRLAGPPFVRRLVQRTLPWGADSRLSADDLAHQMFEHIRAGCKEQGLPRQVYSHIVLSFSPRLSRRAALDPKVRPGLGRHSVFAKALRIVLDALENLGVGEHFPMIAVMHGDRRHLHCHVVVAHHVADSPPCRIHARNPSTLRSIARNLAQAHGLPMSSSTLGKKHKAVVHSTRDRARQ